MLTSKKKYFSFFGILSATVSRKMHAFYCSIETILSCHLPKILKLLLTKQLKPMKLYSTNNISK